MLSWDARFFDTSRCSKSIDSAACRGTCGASVSICYNTLLDCLCSAVCSFAAGSKCQVKFAQAFVDMQNITPLPRSIAAVHIQPPITIRKITAPPTLPGQAPREGFQAVSPRGDGLPPGVKARPIYSPEQSALQTASTNALYTAGSLNHMLRTATVLGASKCSRVRASASLS